MIYFLGHPLLNDWNDKGQFIALNLLIKAHFRLNSAVLTWKVSKTDVRYSGVHPAFSSTLRILYKLSKNLCKDLEALENLTRQNTYHIGFLKMVNALDV